MIFSHIASLPSKYRKLSVFINYISNIKQWLSDNLLQVNCDETEMLLFPPDSQMTQIKQQLYLSVVLILYF